MTHLLSLAFTQFSAAASSALVSAIWEGLLLAAVVSLCLRLLPGITAAARSIVWSAVMLLVVALPFLRFGTRAVATTSNALHVDGRISLALIVLWAAFSIFRAAELIRSALYLRRIACNSRPVAPEPALATLLAGGSRPVDLRVSNEVDRPSVVGFFSPRILVPATLLAKLTSAELEHIVLHEMEHIRRHDDWTNLLQKLSLVLFPLNPVLVWIERRLCLERELACDDRVLHATGARKAYAACLASLAEHTLVRRGVSLALGAWERRPELVRRVHRILTGTGSQMHPRRIAVAVSLLLAGVLASGDALAHSPQLVSFVPAAPNVASLTSPAPLASRAFASHAFTAQMVKAILPPRRSAFRPVAIGSRAAAISARAVAVSAKLRRREIRRPFIAQQIAYTIQSIAPADDPALNPPAGEAGMVVLVTWRTTVVSAPAESSASAPARAQIAPAQTQSLQLRYAAVPTRNGWLFLQL